MIDRITITSREQWLDLRRQDVTASRVGALFDCHPYATALRLYLEYSGVEFPDQPENEAMRRGRLLEGAVALAVAEERPEWRITKATEYFRDPELRLGATPDFFIEGDPRGLGVLQTKTAAPSTFRTEYQKGEVIPLWISLQASTEAMLVPDVAFVAVAVLKIDAFDLRCVIEEWERRPGVEARIRRRVAEFWTDVAAGNEPAPDYGRDAELASILAPREQQGREIDLAGDNYLPALLQERGQLMIEIKQRQERKEEIETEIKFKMQDAERITGLPGWIITWKSGTKKGYTVATKEVRTLRISSKQERAG